MREHEFLAFAGLFVAFTLTGCSMRLPQPHEAEVECWRACNRMYEGCQPKNSIACDVQNSQCVNKCPHD
jgi:hypothetical protein